MPQVGNPVLQNLVRRQTDRIFDPLGFEALVDPRHGEGGIGAEVDAKDLALIAHDDRFEHTLPAVGAVHVAGTQDVTTDPRNCTIRRRSKSSRMEPDSVSPAGFAIAASPNPR